MTSRKECFSWRRWLGASPWCSRGAGDFVEIIESTGGGLLYDAAGPAGPNSPEGLAEGLYRLWSDRGLARTLSARAFEGVRAHYTIEQSASRLLDVYETLRKSQSPLRTSVA